MNRHTALCILIMWSSRQKIVLGKPRYLKKSPFKKLNQFLSMKSKYMLIMLNSSLTFIFFHFMILTWICFIYKKISSLFHYIYHILYYIYHSYLHLEFDISFRHFASSLSKINKNFEWMWQCTRMDNRNWSVAMRE